MSIYGQIDYIPKHRTQFLFKVKQELAYQNQHIDTEMLHDSKDHGRYCNITFNIDFESTD